MRMPAILLALLALLAAVLYYPSMFEEESIVYGVRFSVGEEWTRAGVSADVHEFNFGAVGKGSSVKKTIELENKEETKAKALVAATGNVTPFLEFRGEVIIPAGGKEKIEIIAKAQETGNYTGSLTVRILRPRQRFMEAFLR